MLQEGQFLRPRIEQSFGSFKVPPCRKAAKLEVFRARKYITVTGEVFGPLREIADYDGFLSELPAAKPQWFDAAATIVESVTGQQFCSTLCRETWKQKRKVVPTLTEFCEKQVEPWAKSKYEKASPKTWLPDASRRVGMRCLDLSPHRWALSAQHVAAVRPPRGRCGP
jgi:hypothetical protein